MFPQELSQVIKFLNTGDLAWTILVKSAGEFPPSGAFYAHLKRDLSTIDIELVFSEVRGNLLRGAADAAQKQIPLHFNAPQSDIGGFDGVYQFDLYYKLRAAITPVVRASMHFARGA